MKETVKYIRPKWYELLALPVLFFVLGLLLLPEGAYFRKKVVPSAQERLQNFYIFAGAAIITLLILVAAFALKIWKIKRREVPEVVENDFCLSHSFFQDHVRAGKQYLFSGGSFVCGSVIKIDEILSFSHERTSGRGGSTWHVMIRYRNGKTGNLCQIATKDMSEDSLISEIRKLKDHLGVS